MIVTIIGIEEWSVGQMRVLLKAGSLTSLYLYMPEQEFKFGGFTLGMSFNLELTPIQPTTDERSQLDLPFKETTQP